MIRILTKHDLSTGKTAMPFYRDIKSFFFVCIHKRKWVNESSDIAMETDNKAAPCPGLCVHLSFYAR